LADHHGRSGHHHGFSQPPSELVTPCNCARRNSCKTALSMCTSEPRGWAFSRAFLPASVSLTLRVRVQGWGWSGPCAHRSHGELPASPAPKQGLHSEMPAPLHSRGAHPDLGALLWPGGTCKREEGRPLWRCGVGRRRSGPTVASGSDICTTFRDSAAHLHLNFNAPWPVLK